MLRKKAGIPREILCRRKLRQHENPLRFTRWLRGEIDPANYARNAAWNIQAELLTRTYDNRCNASTLATKSRARNSTLPLVSNETMPPHPPPALDDPELAAEAMLARKRRFLLALAGNALLLVVLLGGPYLRGILRARAMWPRFAEASVCMFGGKARPEPGLGVPRGHEERFAARVLHPEAGFPTRCDDALERLAPDEAIFLLPWLKTREYEVRDAIRLMREELAKITPSSADARISTRPLRAYELLRAALSRDALAAGMGAPPEELAFTFDRPSSLQKPTRVPLFVGGDAALTLWGDDRRFEALGIDGTGLSYLSMEAGTLWPMRVARPKLLQAFLPDNAGGVFVWSMAQARCRDRSDGCTNKTLGLARAHVPVSSLPSPRWFASHPAGRADRSILALSDGWLVAAAAPEGAVELREFAALETADASPSEDLPPLAPRSQYAKPAHGQVLLTELGGAPLVLNAVSRDADTRLHQLTPSGETMTLAQLGPSRRAWVVACSTGQRVGFVLGHAEALRFGELDAEGAVTLWEELPLRVSSAVHDTDPARDHVAFVCGTSEPLGLALTSEGKLVSVSCPRGSAACSVNELGAGVRGFSTLVSKSSALVAYAGSGDHAQVRVLRLDAHGKAVAPASTPGVCWSDARGMCGVPVLARLGSRVVLGAREGTDLLALESPDEGVSWEPLRGIRKQE
jgi:hypothetical protein